MKKLFSKNKQKVLKPNIKEDRTTSVQDPDKMSQQVRLRLLPSVRCLFDEPVQLKVSGLRSRQVVTLRARSTDEKGVGFSSSASYRADGNGEIDVNRDPSLSGSYAGVLPMGLLSYMKPHIPHKQFIKNRALEPFKVNFSVHEEEEDRKLAEETNERFLMADGVRRVPVKEGDLVGVLFTPPGEGPFPAVSDLSTLSSEKKAALLANKGFVVLTVPVIDNKSVNIHLDRFEEAVRFLHRLPEVGSKGVGVISRSKSGDVALSLSAFVPGVEAVVWINGCSANSGAVISKYSIQNHLTEENRSSMIPIEKSKSRFLFVASEDDLSWDSKAYMEQMVDRLKLHGKNNFESLCYPGAGHIMEPPYGPHVSSCFHSAVKKPVLWGGEPRSHSAAEIHLWEKVQQFFRTHLSCDTMQTKSKL